ncbi:MAG: zonular occludens toxin domain-containing protein [Bacillota bacterium]
MPINVYTGLMRSGKSYEVVSEIIVPAIRAGRNVVTNVDGISEEKIHEYLKGKFPEDDHSKYGRINHVTNAQVFDDKFFPYYDDEKNAHTDTIVQPGDLVAIDEAWRFWGDKMKIKKNHQSFILEHGHFTHPMTNVACDMVLMIQDMGTLNRFIKNVVAFTYRTNKKVSLGLSKVYSLNAWEGKSMTKANHIGQWTRTYKKEIFPLYSSFKGGAQGVMVNVDKRQNIFRNWKTWAPLAFAFLVIGIAAPRVYRFFHPVESESGAKAQNGSASAPKSPAGQNVPAQASRPPVPVYSDVWRICGSFYAQGKTWVVVCNPSGAVRVESPSIFHNDGLARTGDIDGSKVAVWSGAPLPKVGTLSGPAGPVAPGALGEIRK